MRPLLLHGRDQRATLTAFTAAMDCGEPVAVLDPAWPDELARAARAQVHSAHARGRLGPGSLVLFTSGSAGRPRGVVRTHESWRASVGPLTSLLGLTSDDVVWTPGPLSSSLSLYGAWHASTVGARTVLADEDPADAGVLHTVPSAFARLRRRTSAQTRAALRTVVLAGEPVTGTHRAECAAEGWAVREYYGAAELSFVGWSADGGPWRPFPGVEVELRGGDLWARSPYLARGYLDEGDGPLRTDAHGWATVGDRAVAVSDGYVVRGRGAASISTGGHTVSAEEVESVLASVPGVRAVLVVGRPDAGLGEVVTALLVGDASANALRAVVQGLPAPARPRRWARVDDLPRTSSGKPDRAAARADVAEGRVVCGPLS